MKYRNEIFRLRALSTLQFIYASGTVQWRTESRSVHKYLTCSPDAVNACRIARSVDNIRAPFTNVNLDGRPGDAIPDAASRYCARVETSVEWGSSLVMAR